MNRDSKQYNHVIDIFYVLIVYCIDTVLTLWNFSYKTWWLYSIFKWYTDGFSKNTYSCFIPIYKWGGGGLRYPIWLLEVFRNSNLISIHTVELHVLWLSMLSIQPSGGEVFAYGLMFRGHGCPGTSVPIRYNLVAVSRFGSVHCD